VFEADERYDDERARVSDRAILRFLQKHETPPRRPGTICVAERGEAEREEAGAAPAAGGSDGASSQSTEIDALRRLR